MTDWVGTAFELFKQQREDIDILRSLLSAGCPRDLAEKLLVFIPHACGRAILADTGIAFPKSYRCLQPDDTLGPQLWFASDADWVSIERAIAARQPAERDAIALIGMRSAEFDAINQALHNGSQLANLVPSEPIFIFTDASGLAGVAGKTKAKPWWAFWR